MIKNICKSGVMSLDDLFTAASITRPAEKAAYHRWLEQ